MRTLFATVVCVVVFAASVVLVGCGVEGSNCADATCDGDLTKSPPDGPSTPDPRQNTPVEMKAYAWEAGIAGTVDLIPDEPDTTDPNDKDPKDPLGPEEPLTLDDLSPDELKRVAVLRTAIGGGLNIGREHYLDTVTLILQDFGVDEDYETLLNSESAGLDEPAVECPYVQYYENGFEPSPVTCEYLVDIAKVDAYAKLTEMLDELPMEAETIPAQYLEEAVFWREQGAISGLEKNRVVVRTDLSLRAICNKAPTPKESSVSKGVLVGRKLFAAKFNKWLSENGYKADYPVMSQPITVCAADVTMLQPALKAAQDAVEAATEDDPLCPGYEPPDLEDKLMFSEASIAYSDGIDTGVEDEYSLATVTVFNVVPCNVSDPLVLDLDGDGIELLPIHRGVNFDLYATGRPHATAWVAPEDGLLALDRDLDGRIGNGSELFGNINEGHADGFSQLAELDQPAQGGNGDGMLDAHDAGFHALLVWRDADSNGISTPGELRALAQVGVTTIPLTQLDRVTLEVAGNRVPLVGSAATVDGPMQIGDAFLRTAPHPRLIRAE